MNSVDEKDYYSLLGVQRDATPEQIKEAYKEIARVYHPDSNYYSEITDQDLNVDQIDVFKTITAAYHTLTNAAKRAAYDQTLAPDLRGWVDPVDEDAEILEALEKMGVEPESVGMQPRREPRKRKNSSAYGIFGTVDAAAELTNNKPPTQPGQFNQTAFGHGEAGMTKKAKKGTLSNLLRPSTDSSEYKAAMPQPMMTAKQPHIPPETDKVKLLLIAFAGTGTVCFVLSLLLFAMLR